jgi:hypothetical protein
VRLPLRGGQRPGDLRKTRELSERMRERGRMCGVWGAPVSGATYLVKQLKRKRYSRFMCVYGVIFTEVSCFQYIDFI